MSNKESKKTKSKLIDKEQGRSSSLSYRGNVTIKLMHGNKTFKVIKGSNKGYNPLFEYLSICLSGTMNKSKAPKYIRTFKTKIVDSQDRKELSDDSATIGSGIPYSSVEINKITNEKGYATAFTFLLPGAAFLSSGTDTLAIYNQDNYDNLRNPSVVYLLNESLETLDDDTNVVIVWEMIVENK